VVKREHGFTLVELIVVMVLIAILTAIALGFQTGARDRGEEAAAKSNIRLAEPAFEVYQADNGGSYVGMSLAGLQAQHSPGIKGIVVLSADATSYCVRSTVGGRSWYKTGPGGQITTTACA
jgi:prepilin-type N-terminal cleavage/methylation domain-containing protein